MQWYYSKNGTQLGPIEQDELIQKLTTGEVTATDLVWRECLPDWLPAGQISELTAAFQPAPQVMPTAGTAPQSPYAPPTAAPRAMSYAGEHIPNYLWQSIVVTILCCWPAGIPAIVYAAKVDGLKASGNFAAAKAASASAKTWCWISFGSIAGILVLYLIGIIIGGALSAA